MDEYSKRLIFNQQQAKQIESDVYNASIKRGLNSADAEDCADKVLKQFLEQQQIGPGTDAQEAYRKTVPRTDNVEHEIVTDSEVDTPIPESYNLTCTQISIRSVCDNLGDMLIAKNKAYGDSALNPLRVFSRAAAEEQIFVRIDDKLSRLSRGTHVADEDTIKDLAGYLVLLMVMRSE